MRSSDDDGGDTDACECELLAEVPTWAGSAEGVGATKAEQPGRSNDEEPSLFFCWPEPDEVRITERSAAAAYLAMMCYRLLL